MWKIDANGTAFNERGESIFTEGRNVYEKTWRKFRNGDALIKNIVASMQTHEEAKEFLLLHVDYLNRRHHMKIIEPRAKLIDDINAADVTQKSNVAGQILNILREKLPVIVEDIKEV